MTRRTSRLVIIIAGAFISCGCSNKLQQSGGLETTEMYSLTVLETRNPNSRWQDHPPSGGSRKESVHCLFQFLEALAFFGLWSHCLISTSVSTLPSPLLCESAPLCVCPVRMNVIAFRAHLEIQDNCPLSRSLTESHIFAL